MFSESSNKNISECSWCQRKLPKSSIGDQRISSKLCGDCINSNDFRLGIPLQKYAESISSPVVIVNDDMVILYANVTTLKFVHRDLPDICGKVCGEVFLCIYAAANNGCGKNINCNGCTIKNAVKETLTDKKMKIQTPALLTQKNMDGSRDYIMMFSTEKAGEVAILRIDTIIPFCT